MTFLEKKKKKVRRGTAQGAEAAVLSERRSDDARCSVLGTPFPALSFGGGAVTEVLHALRCGLALSPVKHDLPCQKKKKKKHT